MKKIIGTGLSGLVGSRVVELLSQYTFEDASLETGVNILDIDQLNVFFNNNLDAQAVIHFAAFTDTNKAWEEKGNKKGQCWLLNVEGTKNVLEMCQKYSKYLIHISTDYVFNGKKKGTYTELDTPEPLDWYGETKYEAEKLVIRSKHMAAIARISYPFRTIFPQKTDVVRKMLNKLKNGEVLNLFEDQVITPTFIDDIAMGIEKIFDKKPIGIYHLVANSHQTAYETGVKVAKIFEMNAKLIKPVSLKEYLKTPGIRPYALNGAISNEKAVKDLGVRLDDFESTLVRMREYLRN